MSTFFAEREGFFADIYDFDRKSPLSRGDIALWLNDFVGDINSSLPLRRQELQIRSFLQSFEDRVLFEDSQMLVLDKPAGVVSHWSVNVPVGVQEVAQHLRGEGVVLVNRLDRYTSGVIVVVKSKDAFVGLAPQFAHNGRFSVEKKYVAILEGEMPLKKVMAEVPLVPDGQKMKVAKGTEIKKAEARSSISYFNPLVLLDGEDGRKRTLVEVQIFTGRTHQIRVVAAQFLGHPVVGDYLYDLNADRTSRTLLHSHSTALTHPTTHERMIIRAPVPEDFLAMVK